MFPIYSCVNNIFNKFPVNYLVVLDFFKNNSQSIANAAKGKKNLFKGFLFALFLSAMIFLLTVTVLYLSIYMFCEVFAFSINPLGLVLEIAKWSLIAYMATGLLFITYVLFINSDV